MRHLVVLADCFLKGFEFHHIQNGSEDFLVDDWSIVSDLHDGGKDEVALGVGDCATTVEDLTALSLDGFDSIKVVLNRFLGVEWAKKSVLIHGVTHACSDFGICLY